MLKITLNQLTEEEKEKLKPVKDNRENIAQTIMDAELSHKDFVVAILRTGIYLDSYLATNYYLISDLHKSVEFGRKIDAERIVGWQQADIVSPDKIIYALYKFAPKVVQKAWKNVVEQPDWLWKQSNFEKVQKCLVYNYESNNQLTICDYDMYGNFIEPDEDEEEIDD